MSKKKITQSEIDAILNTVAHFPDGASIEKIFDKLKLPLTHRTLQRRLKYLAENNLLSIEGKTRARLYQLPSSSTTAAVQAAHKKGFLSLSLAAHSIQVKVSQPIQARIPVSYRRVFLDKYRPNETYYLPLQVRRHLFQLGKSPMIERPAGTYARQILSRLLIDLSWNSSRLEGNTYSLLETKRLLELGEVAEGKNAKEAQMILNHKAAIEFLVESADGAGFNRYTILNLHALLSHNLLSDSGACGRLRTIPVEIGESTYQPLAVPQLIQECFQQILDTANAIENPLEQAFFVMVHIPYLQPFEDVNKRVSRLAANMPLIRQNLCPLSFTDVPEDLYISGLLGIYELNRIELLRDIFIWAYERSCLAYSSTRQTLGEPDPFRLKYRDHIFEVTTRIVRLCLSLNDAKHIIQEQAKEISPAQEQARFIEIVEAEVKGLHEGNIARYRLRPSEYEAWQNATSARK